MIYLIEYEETFLSHLAGRHLLFSKDPNEAIQYEDETYAEKIADSVKVALRDSRVTVRKAKVVVTLI